MDMSQILRNHGIGAGSRDKTPPLPTTNIKAYGCTGTSVRLTWTNPTNDTDWMETRVVRKETGIPTSPYDGVLIYSGTGTQVIDTNVVSGTRYFYIAFSIDYDGNFNNSSTQAIDITAFKSWTYGFQIDESNTNPSTAVTYTDDCVGFTPLYNDPTTGVCNYGSWANTEIVTGNKPCALNQSTGAFMYYLNPNNLTQKADGTAADVMGYSTSVGEAMAEFQKTYYKCSKSGNIVSFKVSNVKIDDSWVCTAFLDTDLGMEHDKMYIGIYKSSVYNSAGRSRYNVNPTVQNWVNAVNSCENKGIRWEGLMGSRVNYVANLIVLLTKTRNVQTALGMGNVTGTVYKNSGSNYTKGQFFGTSSTTGSVTAFFLEDLWGDCYQWLVGLSYSNGLVTKVKRPFTMTDYNNYVTSGGYTQTGLVLYGSVGGGSGYFNNAAVTPDGSMIIPIGAGASTTTGYCDGIANDTGRPIGWGGNYDQNLNSGIFYMRLSWLESDSTYVCTTRLTYC
jgi:hypothetical protein